MLKDQRALILLDESNDRVAWWNASPLQLLYQRWQIIGLRRHFTSIHSNPLQWVFILIRRGRSFESISADFENSRSPLAMSSGSLPKRDRIGFSGSFIRSSSLKRLCRPRLDRRQSESSRRFWAERDSESTALTCRRHSITFASRPIDRRATMRLRQRAQRGHSPMTTART